MKTSMPGSTPGAYASHKYVTDVASQTSVTDCRERVLRIRKWVLRSSIIWHRKDALPEAVLDRPRRSYEYLFMLAKSRKYFFNRSALEKIELEEDVWTISARPKPTNGLDTAAFPDELVRRCLDFGCPSEGHVLDPFAGSGTTAIVAVKLGRVAIGIDLSEQYVKLARKRLSYVEWNNGLD